MENSLIWSAIQTCGIRPDEKYCGALDPEKSRSEIRLRCAAVRNENIGKLHTEHE